MNFILPNTRKSLVCELSDYILFKIKKQSPKSVSRIEIVDFINFFVVNGYTTSKEILDINSIVDEFKEVSKTYNFVIEPIQINIIDIIKYNTKKEFQSPSEFNFTFYNTSRPIFPIDSNYISPYLVPVFDYINFDNGFNFEVFNLGSCNVINENSILCSKSEFPYGFENDFKINLYFFERIVKHLFKICNTNKITISYNTQQDQNEEINIGQLKINANSQFSDKILESLVKDVFDFNFSKFQVDYLNDYDFTQEITNPFEEKPWLILDKIKDLVII